MAWLTGWTYRKEITITGSTGGSQTNYVIPVTVNYGSGSDSGRQVYAGSNCETNFGDIRFTQSDGSTELDYFLDQKTDSDKALFWFEANSIPASPDTATFYVYYGKASTSTTSNGESTYQAFESFENSPTFDFDTAGGTDISLTSSTSYTPKDGSYVGINSGTQGYKKKLDNTTSFDSNYIAEGWVKTLSGGGTNENLGPGITILGAAGNNNGYEAIMDLRGAVSPQIREAWDYGSRTNGNYTASLDTWYFLDFRHSGTQAIARLYTEAQAYTGSAQTTTTKTDSTYTSGYYGIGTYNANHSAWDSFRVRKYVNPEPSITSWGSEEEEASGDIAVNADIITTTSSLPAPTITAVKNVSVSAGLLSNTLNIPTPTITTTSNVTVSADLQSSSLSLPAPSISGSANVSVGTLSITTTVPAPTVSGSASIAPDPVTLTTPIPSASISVGDGASPAQIDLSLSLPTPTVSTTSNVSITPNPVTLALSIPNFSVSTVEGNIKRFDSTWITDQLQNYDSGWSNSVVKYYDGGWQTA